MRPGVETELNANISSAGWKKVYLMFDEQENHSCILSISDGATSVLNITTDDYYGLTNEFPIYLYQRYLRLYAVLRSNIPSATTLLYKSIVGYGIM